VSGKNRSKKDPQSTSYLQYDDEKMNLYSAWFCPYAQRAWMVLEHCSIPYNYIESLLLNNESNGDHGYTKNPRLLEVNPKGLVPTIELSTESMTELGLNMEDLKDDERITIIDKAFVVKESIVCMEFIQSISRLRIQNRSDIIPETFFVLDAKKLDEKVCSVFYKVLMMPSLDEQKSAYESFANGISEFIGEVKPDGFYKSETPTIVDFTIMPWLLRLFVLNVYRPTLSMKDYIGAEKNYLLESYIERMKKLDAVQKTMWSDNNAMIEVYRTYAEGTATSKVAKAVRSGGNAHDV